jgi:predicted acetyltransferase
MPELSPPTETVKESFLAAMAEFRAEGRGAPGERSMIASEMQQYGDTWHSDEGFETYVRELRAQGLEDTPRPEGRVPCTTFWWIDGHEYLGRIAVRHRLTAHLLEDGGHIGYDVRASARRRGHATAMLRAVLPYAASVGIEKALVTCDAGNVGSRTVIEACGGVLEDERNGVLRFWLPTT